MILQSDNIAVVHVINKHIFKEPYMMTLMRRRMLFALQHNIHFVPKQFPGVCNTAADTRSRLQVPEFQARFPHMHFRPTQIPL